MFLSNHQQNAFSKYFGMGLCIWFTSIQVYKLNSYLFIKPITPIKKVSINENFNQVYLINTTTSISEECKTCIPFLFNKTIYNIDDLYKY
jgi:hypothetical protein